MFMSMLLGGRVVYTGKDITGAHAQPREQGLKDTRFDVFLKHFRAALEEVGGQGRQGAEKVMKLLVSWASLFVLSSPLLRTLYARGCSYRFPPSHSFRFR
jgi:truncated hemoglobin YjbI